MELPAGFQPVAFIPPPKEEAPPPPPPAPKPPRKEKEPQERFNVVRAYYVGAFQVAYLEQRTHADGQVRFSLVTQEWSSQIESLEAADRYVTEHLRGRPREVPTYTEPTLNGFRVLFRATPEVAIEPLPFPPPPPPAAEPAPAPQPVQRVADPNDPFI